MTTSIYNPQLVASQAQAALIAQHPGLASARWSLGHDGSLSGTITRDADFDVRPLVDAYATVIGGTPREDRFVDPGTGVGSLRVTLHGSWQGVPVSVWASCRLSALPPAPALEPLPADLLRAQLRNHPEIVSTEVDGDTLHLTVQPGSAANWQAWCDLVQVDPESMTCRGRTVTCRGFRSGVHVALTGVGAGSLMATAALAGGAL